MVERQSPFPPPADPWGPDEQPLRRPTAPLPEIKAPEPPPMYGRAQVPGRPLRQPTAEMPQVEAAPARRPAVSWERRGSAARRSLSDGWGLTAAGLLIAFCGWGLWAAAGRGSIASPLAGLAFMLVVAVGVFALSRLLGYMVLTRMLGRRRLHARWSHLLTGVFLAAGGISYLANTTWVEGADGWIDSAIAWIGDQWRNL
jgi:hypothetical protein